MNTQLDAIKELPSERLLSLDALRGFDMMWIVGAGSLVDALHKVSNAGVTGFLANQLEHRKWEGFVFEDCIFPLFVFMMGVAAVYSLPKMVAREGSGAAHLRLLKRTLLLFLLGVFVNGGLSHPFDQIRYMGVLQRIGLCYGFAGLALLHLRPRNLVILSAALLLGYWALLTFVPAPGQAVPSFEEGKNLTDYIDEHYLIGAKHAGKPWDPEGVLSTIPAVGGALLGVLAGYFLQDRRYTPQQKAAYLFAAGLVFVVLGYAWGFQFPVIKKIWTSSFVFVATGYSCMLLSLFFWVIDIQKWRGWATPFVWIGTNSLAIYMARAIIPFPKVAERLAGEAFRGIFGDYNELVTALVALGLIFYLAKFLHKKNIFLRV